MSTRFIKEFKQLPYVIIDNNNNIIINKENNNDIYAIVNYVKNIDITIKGLRITNNYPMECPDIRNLEIIFNNKLDKNKEILKLNGLKNIMNYLKN